MLGVWSALNLKFCHSPSPEHSLLSVTFLSLPEVCLFPRLCSSSSLCLKVSFSSSSHVLILPGLRSQPGDCLCHKSSPDSQAAVGGSPLHKHSTLSALPLGFGSHNTQQHKLLPGSESWFCPWLVK